VKKPESERLRFVPWTEADADLAWTLWGDPRVTRLFSKEPLTREQVAERLRVEIDRGRTLGIQYWKLETAGPAAVFVGAAGLKPRSKGVLELGFHLLPEHWGQGYATEAGRAIAAFAFNQLGVRALFAGHHPENHGSRAALEKIGFRYVHDELFPPTGLMHPGYEIVPEVRPNARCVVVDREGRVLLSGVHDETLDVRTVWVTPGGGLEPGETPEEAARRELYEETGLRVGAVGPCVWTRRHVWRWGTRWIDGRDRYYVVRTERYSPRMAVVTPEAETIREWRWWSAGEIRASADVFAPRRIGDLLDALLRGLPAAPIDTGT
jgi:ribosomal-protein-alanine N-acetyltransferase